MDAVNPKHIGIIMDGNGRWAAQRDLPRSEGHRFGAKTVRRVISAAQNTGVRYLTLYAFSTENWGRPEQEVNGLFELLVEYLENEVDEFNKNGICLKVIGDIESLPPEVGEALEVVMEQTSSFENKFVLTLALSYGSRAELVRASRLLAEEVARGEISPDAINADSISEKLWTLGTPDPDLLIRTGGDLRLSNFLLWQCAYAELYFTKTLWPDFDEKEFEAALKSYRGRERRFGLAE